jgi:mannose-6-phosphate isomerase-like protein (cupin superfamily)
MLKLQTTDRNNPVRFGASVILGLALVVVGLFPTVAAAQNSEAKSPPPHENSKVAYFDTKAVDESFAKGNPGLLFRGNGFDKGPGGQRNFELHTSSRKTPGDAELHELETDIIYVVEGSATCVTGGTIVDPKTVRPNQIRGPRIEGGETSRLTKGSVIVIPNGVPHWFSEVQGPIVYFVVKVH